MPLPMPSGVGLGMRRVIFSLLWLLAGLASAQEMETTSAVWVHNGIEYTNANSSCNAYFEQNGLGTNYTVGSWVKSSGSPPTETGYCHATNKSNGADYIFTTKGSQCPTASPTWTADTSIGLCKRSITCAARAGTHRIVNLTIGWKRTNNPEQYNDFVVGPSWPPGSICAAQCQLTRGDIKAAWTSQTPAANGLHRESGDFDAVYTGATCTAGDTTPGADPTAAPPPCPGQLGQVNGNPVCFGTPSTPLPSNPNPVGAPPSGLGNPAAGPMPTSGPGSSGGPGRTPVSGDGSDAGGGSSSSIPGGGSTGNGQGNGTPQPTNPDGTSSPPGSGGGGTSTPADPVEVCGLPGKAPCKVDETGTPDGTGAYGDATTAVNGNQQSAVQGINDAAASSGKGTGWSFSFAFPTGCSPVPLAGFEPYLTSVDVCQWQPQIHDLMSMVWLAVTVFVCIGMVGRAVGGGGS